MKNLIFIIIILTINPARLYSQDVQFRKITSNQGLSHNTVYAIAQDEQGFMWFGTREGLNRYDSNNLKNYYIKDSKLGGSANKISSLLCYKSLIYVGTDNGLYVYDSRTDKLSESKVFGERKAVLFIVRHSQMIYVGTTEGLYRIAQSNSSLISQPVYASAMCIISDNQFLVALDDQLMIMNEEGNIIRRFKSDALLNLTDATIYSIYKDEKSRIWISSNRGLFRFNRETQRFSSVKFTSSENPETNTVRSVSVDKEDKLYIGTEDGLYIYHIKTGKSENYQQSFSSDIKKLNDKAIYSTFLAKDNTVWLGTYFGGVNYIPSNSTGFRSLKANDKEQGLAGKAISQLMEDAEHNIWITTEDGGISIYNPVNESYSPINTKSSPFYLSVNNVHAVHDDGYGNIWAGTFLGGLHRFDQKAKTTTIYTNQPANRHSLSNNQVYAIYRDSKGQLWIGTQNGLNLFDYRTSQFRLLKPEVLGNKFIYDLTEDKNGDLWICTRQNGIYRYNSEDGTLLNFKASGTNPRLLSNQIISVYKDSKQQLWFGTLDGGASRYNHDTDKFTNYSMADGLPNNNVYGILEDEGGAMWFSTNRGISKLDQLTKKFTNYDNKYGLPSNQFNFKSFLKSSDGTLYFGSINGLSYFKPTLIATTSNRLSIRLTDFQLFNESVVPGESSILQQQIDFSKVVELAYSQNVFTISYAAINYSNPGSTSYAYYLEGFEDKWNFVGNKTSVTYTNLSAGEYIFHVQAVDADGNPSSAERSLKITVAPPFYSSTLAYLFYLLLIAAIIWMYTRIVKYMHNKRLEIQLERVEKEKIKELTRHRLNFFTFISHEFKTPLTLILASIDKFIEEKGAELKRNSDLTTIKSNASVLFKLIQQLMEFRKIETDHASINLVKSDIVLFIRNATLNFETVAAQKGIDLVFSSSVPGLACYFDHDKMEKIFFNILSNAVKNTSSGSIEVSLQFEDLTTQKSVTIEVRDTGKGMSSIELKNIFNPFYQHRQTADPNSSGIGLALVKSLVKYLSGDISIKSEPQKGTSVVLTFPILVRPDTTSVNEEREAPLQDESAQQQAIIHSPGSVALLEEKSTYTLLLVEDNRELLNFLAEHFSKTYIVITAGNGLTALNKIVRKSPDIIISDINMPKMDGFELCEKLKSDKRFDHIPVILLSDSNKENIHIDGLDQGADAYLSKPFNLKEIELLVSNMIKSRVKLREHVIGIGEFSADHLPSNNKDQQFLERLSSVLEKRFSNPNISIDDIAKELNMSRTSLHLNLKRSLRKNATELLNEYRLKRAAIMLENDMPVNEAAYHCGYSDPNYFARIFKRHYNETPVKFKEKNRKMKSSDVLG